MSKLLIQTLVTAAVMTLATPSFADEVEPIYGSQLMTQQERQEHRQAMQSAKTAEEREMIRQQNHEKMRLRAQEKGVTLPDEAPMNRGHINQNDRPGMGRMMQE